VTILPKRRDIDKEEDLGFLEGQPSFQDQVSIIIPFLNGMRPLAGLVDSLEAQLWPGDEIILVKGDKSSEQAAGEVTSNTRLIFSPKGRGAQLNSGVGEAHGNMFWFLHADSVPPPNFGFHIRKLSQAPGFSLGCFELSFVPDLPLLKLIARWANLRTIYFNLPYGDQGLFCRRGTFERVGGFKKQFLMEDVDFVSACNKLGKLLIIPEPLCSSPQRYLRKGILRAVCQNHFLMLLYLLGVSDERLHRLYYSRI
jgi:hypothetical protein